MLLKKFDALIESLAQMKQVLVAFSGGVDSSFLAFAAQKALNNKAAAVTACSNTFTKKQREESAEIAKIIGIRQIFLKSGELDNADFIKNNSKRCYYCKKERFNAIRKWADENKIRWIIEGSNADDEKDYRPGKAALKEISGVRSPLLEAGLTKTEIRELSKTWNLPTFAKPSDSCLAARIAYNLPITLERLKQVEEAEAFLGNFFQGQIRLRHHGDLARIEVEPKELEKFFSQDNTKQITAFLKKLDFLYITADLNGYRTGSLNEVLEI